MRKLTVILCVLWFLAMVRSAGAVGWSVGIKGGANMGDLSGDNGPTDTSMRNGFAGGVFADYRLSERLGVRTEVLFIQKGAEGSFVVPGDDHAHDSIIQLDYVEIPLLFVGRLPAGDAFLFSVFAGPTLAFNTTAEVEVPSHHETRKLDAVEDFEIGGAFGGGIEYMFSLFSLLADVRYGLGTTSVVQDMAGESVDVKNRGVAIMGGVSFPLGKR